MKTKKTAPISLPPIGGKEVTISFDGDPVTLNDDSLLFAETGERLGVFAVLAGAIRDRRDPRRVTHSFFEIVRERCTAIASGYPDADDLDALRDDAALKMAAGKETLESPGLASQPTVSRFENDATWQDIVRLSLGLIDIYCTTAYEKQPRSITLDIDTTFYRANGKQEGTSWSEHNGERGYAPIHVYDIDTGTPVAIALASATAPSGDKILRLAKSLIRRIRRHWPETQIILRGDSRFAHWQVMDYCDGQKGVDYIFGFERDCLKQGMAEIRSAEEEAMQVCGPEVDDTGHGHCAFLYRSQSWKTPRRVVCWALASQREFMNSQCVEIDRRFIVTSLENSTPEEIYQKTYRTRGQGENLTKLHKNLMKSSRLPCRSAVANQMRLILYSASYFLVCANERH